MLSGFCWEVLYKSKRLCTHLDSTFIGVLVITYKKLLANGGELKLVEPLEPAKGLFHLTGISKVFDTFEVDVDALLSFNKEPNIREYVLAQ